MHCYFCGKSQSEVRYLVDWAPMAAICDKCVYACQGLIDERKKSKNSDTLIIGTKRARSLMMRPKLRKP